MRKKMLMITNSGEGQRRHRPREGGIFTAANMPPPRGLEGLHDECQFPYLMTTLSRAALAVFRTVLLVSAIALTR